eukprot:CAMPEP_0114434322 /NCGR_PEP_ID=MMETSP0103-20121206/12198_1 /TAXON_ID=37642 ORGANISM="Paraphysomonas imperforata, Strain PA2" /NCGR_SAMPLE_ID=MMETSP0103 /ASSEMBLY_ACC=CAM_ASM_000201 /LENGTH=623 /DNA_ID=CAMNT_0001604199 /DNA_START=44 /DNA_END=1915 /DNA_ORIENTATION=-
MSNEENPYVLATCPMCGVIHTESSPHSYRYVDDVTFFDEHQLRDPLNMEPIFNPVCLAPPCRHTFSKDTIEATIRLHGCCPLDRTPQSVDSIIPAPFIVQNLLDKIRVLCPNNCSDDAIFRCMLPRHLLSCPLTLLSCQRGVVSGKDTAVERCNQRIRLCDAVAHSAVCEYRTFPCSKGCGQVIAAKHLNSHVCPRGKPSSKPTASPSGGASNGGGGGPGSGPGSGPIAGTVPGVNMVPVPGTVGGAGAVPVATTAATTVGGTVMPGNVMPGTGAVASFNGVGGSNVTAPTTALATATPTGVGGMGGPPAGNDSQIAPPSQKKRQREPTGPPILKENVGAFQWAWGSAGSQNSQFQCPSGITLSSNDKEIFVVDNKNHRVQVFNRRGEYLRKWGEFGHGNGHLNHPNSIAISPLTGEVFITDGGNSRIQVFDHKGNYIREWGDHGKDDGQFEQCFGIAISRRQEIYVSDCMSNRIQVFTRYGGFLRQFGGSGNMDGKFSGAYGMAISNIDEIFVADVSNHRVQVFSEQGNFLRKFGSFGTGDGMFNSPFCVAVHGSEDKVYVTDNGNNRVQMFTTAGSFLRSVGGTGHGDGTFQCPSCVAISSCNGDIFVSDNSTGRIQIFVG